jgi:condensin complex subunit 1
VTEAVNAVYLLADNPGLIAEDIMKEMTNQLLVANNNGKWSKKRLAMVLFVAGQVALQHSLHLDSIERHLKRENQHKSNTLPAALSILDQQPADDDIHDMIRAVKENDLFYGEKSLLGVFGRMAAGVLINGPDIFDIQVMRAASLCLCKMMFVSERFCREHLALFLRTLAESRDTVIRANMAIAFGDLTRTNSRLFEGHVDHLFQLLQSEHGDEQCRHTALMVITHLALTGMIKVRGRWIGEVAMLTDGGCSSNDADNTTTTTTALRDLARMFFTELAGKDTSNSVIYNHLPDIFSHVSERCATDPDRHTRILRYLLTFIKKDRQIESLVEKVIARFRLDTSGEGHVATANCLAALPVASEKAVARLLELWPAYKEAVVGDEAVRGVFVGMASRFKKMQALSEQTREAVSKWEHILMGEVV